MPEDLVSLIRVRVRTLVLHRTSVLPDDAKKNVKIIFAVLVLVVITKQMNVFAILYLSETPITFVCLVSLNRIINIFKTSVSVLTQLLCSNMLKT